MDKSLSIFGQVKNFGKKQSIKISDDDFDEFDEEVAIPDDGRSMTGRYERRKRIDTSLMFEEPAQRSLEKHKDEAVSEHVDPIISRLLLEHWVMFFNCFREDERDFEQAEFLEHAQDVQTALDKLDEGEIPDLVTQRQILYLTTRFTKEHFDSRNARIDELQDECKMLRHQKESIALSNCLHEDETSRCVDMVKSNMDLTSESAALVVKQEKPKLRELLKRFFDKKSKVRE